MTYTASEMMTIAAARALGSDDICFVGIGLPSAACNLARLTHAPKLKLVYESGTLETKPQVLPLSIGDGELCETALTTVSVPEMFQYWLQGGRMTVGFLSGAQVDRFGNLQLNCDGARLKKVGLSDSSVLEVRLEGHRLQVHHGATFADVPSGDFVLVEDSYKHLSLAINKGDARAKLRAASGSTVIVGPIAK